MRYPGRLVAVHADLGRAEWGGYDPSSPLNTLTHVRRMCGPKLQSVKNSGTEKVDKNDSR